MLLRENLRATNSLTKYPSILTYHALDDRGRVTDEVLVSFDVSPILVTEKIDGTNARIICHRGDYLIGSREELLTARGDCIHNPALGIVDALHTMAERAASYTRNEPEVVVVFGEVYGGKASAASKQYTVSSAVGFRVFDVVTFTEDEFREMSTRDPRRIAAWRDGCGQRFMEAVALANFVALADLERVPVIGTWEHLPTTPGDVLTLLRATLPSTRAGIDANGRAEGLVARTADRKRIAKLRFEDYERGQKR